MSYVCRTIYKKNPMTVLNIIVFLCNKQSKNYSLLYVVWQRKAANSHKWDVGTNKHQSLLLQNVCILYDESIIQIVAD